MKKVTVFAPATIANFGPGFDIFGVAIRGIGDIIIAKKLKSGIELIVNPGTFVPTQPGNNTAGIAAIEVLQLLGNPGGVSLLLKKGLPIGSGLGSSAASAAASAFAVNTLYGNKISKEDLILCATKAEEKVSGFHADNTAPALIGGAVLVQSLSPLAIISLGNIDDLKIILAIPDIPILTKTARKILPRKITLEKHIENSANVASLVSAFLKNDYCLLSNSLVDTIVEPVRAKLIPGFEKVRKAAFTQGADGFSISGSGPTVFAITDGKKNKAIRIGKEMVNAFHKENLRATYRITSIDPQGARILT